jgi:hypothetical protein
MITEVGRRIISKYLVGQAPSFGSHIAVGCGPKRDQLTALEYASKDSMDFEMFRVPIVSRGFVVEDGVSKVVFTAELPTEERYEITEVGLYPAGENAYAGGYDSKILYSFSDPENWTYVVDGISTEITTITDALDAGNATNSIDSTVPVVFESTADNLLFNNATRQARQERPRFLNGSMFLRGDASSVTITGGAVSAYSGDYIQLDGTGVDLSQNAPTDEIRLAMSLISKTGNNNAVPATVGVVVKFVTTDNESAVASFALAKNTDYTESNRYIVASKEVKDIVASSSAFSWLNVTKVLVYAQTSSNDDSHYLCLDGMRFENLNTTYSIYGLTGYAVVITENDLPLVKKPNSSGFIEFRFGVGV